MLASIKPEQITINGKAAETSSIALSYHIVSVNHDENFFIDVPDIVGESVSIVNGRAIFEEGHGYKVSVQYSPNTFIFNTEQELAPKELKIDTNKKEVIVIF